MRSQVAKRILAKTPEDVKIFTGLYGDLLVRIHDLMTQKGLSQKALAKGMGKNPSEISKWLNGEHNFTLRSLSKLQAELGEPLILIPKQFGFEPFSENRKTMNVPRTKGASSIGFKPVSISHKRTDKVAA